jgi:hypothetical protein
MSISLWFFWRRFCSCAFSRMDVGRVADVSEVRVAWGAGSETPFHGIHQAAFLPASLFTLTGMLEPCTAA